VTDAWVKARTVAAGVPGAPLVVLAHGLEDAWTSWLPLANCIDPDWRVVALDLPWRPGNDYRWRTRSAADWLGEALNLVGARPDVLVAHSYGANATLDLLCALDLRPGPAVMLVCPLYRQPKHPVSWRMFDLARSIFVTHVREGLRARLGSRAQVLDPAVLQVMADLVLDRVGPSGFVTVFDQFAASGDLQLFAVEVPTLVLAGGADPTLSRGAALALAAGMPGADIQINDHYDHFCHIRQAADVAVQLADFVASTSGRPVVGAPAVIGSSSR